MNLSDLTPAQLRRAAALKERIAKLQRQVANILGSVTPAPAAPAGRNKKFMMSAAAKAAISRAAKARWAKIKAAQKKK